MIELILLITIAIMAGLIVVAASVGIVEYLVVGTDTFSAHEWRKLPGRFRWRWAWRPKSCSAIGCDVTLWWGWALTLGQHWYCSEHAQPIVRVLRRLHAQHLTQMAVEKILSDAGEGEKRDSD